MKTSVITLIGTLLISGCQSPARQSNELGTKIHASTDKEGFLASLPENIQVLQDGPNFITIEHTDQATGEKSTRHIWFVGKPDPRQTLHESN